MVGLICSDRLNGRLFIEAKSSSSHWSLALSQHRADAFTISCPHAQMLWMSVCLVLAVWSLISFHSRFEFLSSPFFRFHRTFRVHRVFISAGWHSYCVCCVAVQEHRIQSVLWHCARTHSMFNSILCSVSTSNELSHISELPVLFFFVCHRAIPLFPLKSGFNEEEKKKKTHTHISTCENTQRLNAK